MRMLEWALAILAVGGLTVAVMLLWWATIQRRRVGLPAGRVVYTDTGAWNRCERPLFSHRYLLTGKPDYLVEEQGRIIPVEVKSTAPPPQPYRSHVLQLAAYCLLVEEEFGRCPDHGLIHYRGRTFAVDYTPELRAELIAMLEEMRAGLSATDVPRDHESASRCQACGYREDCDQRLA
ncbi:MAG: CRISPR-associated protein Cas4 [Anaerolineae bacterium]|nr:CRISPR-associated protein Cas4 [Anaerolineae bacterium]MDH7475688.1 CRISPR-associated protein Cas4 [Anaerolineae bacterium]